MRNTGAMLLAGIVAGTISAATSPKWKKHIKEGV